MAESFERRKYKRCQVEVPLNISDTPSSSNGISSNGYSYDISLCGARIHSKKAFPVDSKTYISLSIPDEAKHDVYKMNVIGKVIRVEEISVGNYTVALGIEFQNMNEENIALLKDYLQKSLTAQKKSEQKKEIAKPDDPDAASDEVVIEGEEENSPLNNTPEMGFVERLQHRDDYTDIFSAILKYALIGGFLYVAYYILQIILKLSDLS